MSVCVHTVPYLGSVEPNRTARPEARPEPALAISGPDSCFLYWGHSTTGGGPRNKEKEEKEKRRITREKSQWNPYNVCMIEP